MNHKYRLKDEPCNAVCGKCKKPTWTRQGIFTCYHGLGNYWNDINKKEAISYFTLNGVICKKCWNKK